MTTMLYRVPKRVADFVGENFFIVNVLVLNSPAVSGIALTELDRRQVLVCTCVDFQLAIETSKI